jgi:hypothetical protein
MSYHWQADGTLATDTPLSESAPPPVPPLAPVGQPDGGSAFTIWQPGFVAGVSHPGPSGPSHLPGIYVWSTTVEAWSPNARYLLVNGWPKVHHRWSAIAHRSVTAKVHHERLTAKVHHWRRSAKLRHPLGSRLGAASALSTAAQGPQITR